MGNKTLGALLHEKQDELGLDTSEVAQRVELTDRHYRRLLSDEKFNEKPFALGLKLLNAKRIGTILHASLDEIAEAVECTGKAK